MRVFDIIKQRAKQMSIDKMQFQNTINIQSIFIPTLKNLQISQISAFIIIIIIIKVAQQHEFLWLSLTIRSYQPLFLVSHSVSVQSWSYLPTPPLG